MITPKYTIIIVYCIDSLANSIIIMFEYIFLISMRIIIIIIRTRFEKITN